MRFRRRGRFKSARGRSRRRFGRGSKRFKRRSSSGPMRIGFRM